MKKTHIYLLFFASGISGLVYEIIWMRKLALIFGCTTYATTAVLSAFMGGLALGSFLFGRVVDWQRNPLRLYGLIEIGIGLSTLLVMVLLLPIMDSTYVAAYRFLPESGPLLIAMRFVLAVLILIVPTTLMGGTLPILSRYFVRRVGALGLEIGNLYAINTLGAVFGCFMTGFVLIRAFGETPSVAIAIAINLLVGVIMLLAPAAAAPARGSQEEEEAPVEEPTPEQSAAPDAIAPPSSAARVRAALWAFGLAGFASLAYEVIWTRTLINIVGSDVYCFTIILTTFLLGITLGSFIVARFVDRVRKPYLLFGLFEVAIGCLALATIPLVHMLPEINTRIMTFFGEAQLARTPFAVRTVSMFGLAFIMFIGPTLFMGAVFPVVNRIYHRDLKTIGRCVGDVYSVNTLGTILGAAAGGFLALPLLGIAGSIVAISVINLSIGVVVCFLERRTVTVVTLRWIGAGAAAAALAALFTFGYHRGIPQYFTLRDSDSVAPYYKETPSATLYVSERPHGRTLWGYPIRRLHINRHPTAHNVYRDIVVHKMLAHVPLLWHDSPERALVVGFGIGSTSYSMMQHPHVNVDCVELLRDEIDTAKYFLRENHDVINAGERFNLIINDGRNYILATEAVYDVISVNAIDPRLSPALYTWNFFSLCRDAMSPGGVMALWLPTYRISADAYCSIYKSFQDVFPHSFVLYSNQSHFLLVGSDQPISIDLDRFRARAAVPSVRDSLGEVGLEDPLVLLSTVMLTPEGLAEVVRDGRLNTDLNPVVEFDREQIGNPTMNPVFFRAVLGQKSSILPYVDCEDQPRHRQALARLRRYSNQLSAWMAAQLVYHDGSRPDGMGQMMRALHSTKGNTFLAALMATYGPEVLQDPRLREHAAPLTVALEDLLAAKPSMVLAHRYLATLRARHNDPEAALKHSEAIARLRPDDWMYLYTLGGDYHNVGRNEDARRCFRRLLDMDGGRASGLYGLAVLAADEGRFKAAEKRLSQALRESPEMVEARRLLERVRGVIQQRPRVVAEASPGG